MKKGQVTLLVVLAVVIIAVVLIIYLLSNNSIANTLTKNKISPEVQPIHNQLENCIEQRSKETIQLIGLQGGHLFLPNDYLKTNTADITYGIKNNKNSLISINEIENQLNNYLSIIIPLCIEDNNFQDQEITRNNLIVNSEINQNEINIQVDYPLTIKKNEDTFELNNPYQISINFPLGKSHNIANTIITNQLRNLDFVNLDLISNQEFKVDILPYNQQITTFSIIDEQSEFTFRFGVKK